MPPIASSTSFNSFILSGPSVYGKKIGVLGVKNGLFFEFRDYFRVFLTILGSRVYFLKRSLWVPVLSNRSSVSVAV